MAATASDGARRKTVVLIGRRGDGKSSTGNTLLGQRCFSNKSMVSQTSIPCLKESTQTIPNFSEVSVIDTPGLFDTEVSQDTVARELSRIFELAPDGVDAFLIVLRIGRYTQELHNTIKYVKALFGSEAMKYVIAVFARADDLEDDGMTFEDYIAQMPKDIAGVLPGPKIAFNNRSASDEQKQQQALQLLTLVAKMPNKVRYTAGKVPTKSPMYPWITRSRNSDPLPMEEIQIELPGTMFEPQKGASKSPQEQSFDPLDAPFYQPQGSSKKPRYIKKEEEIAQLKIAVVGHDSDEFVSKLLKTISDSQSEEKTKDVKHHADDPCVSHQAMINGRSVLFVDAGTLDAKESKDIDPGTLDAKESKDVDAGTVDAKESKESSSRVVESVFKIVSGGLHWFFLVIRVGTDAKNQLHLINTFKRVFGDGAMKYTVVVFSNASYIGTDFPIYIANLPKEVRRLIRRPVDKNLLLPFDNQYSVEAFNEGVTKLFQDVYEKAEQRETSECCYRRGMAPSGETSEQETPNASPTRGRLVHRISNLLFPTHKQYDLESKSDDEEIVISQTYTTRSYTENLN